MTVNEYALRLNQLMFNGDKETWLAFQSDFEAGAETAMSVGCNSPELWLKALGYPNIQLQASGYDCSNPEDLHGSTAVAVYKAYIGNVDADIMAMYRYDMHKWLAMDDEDRNVGRLYAPMLSFSYQFRVVTALTQFTELGLTKTIVEEYGSKCAEALRSSLSLRSYLESQGIDVNAIINICDNTEPRS